MSMFRVILVSAVNIIDNFLDETSALSAAFSCVGNPALLSILGARLLFNMKEAGAKWLNQGISCGSKSTASEAVFAPPSAVATTNQQQDDTAGAASASKIETHEVC